MKRNWKRALVEKKPPAEASLVSKEMESVRMCKFIIADSRGMRYNAHVRGFLLKC